MSQISQYMTTTIREKSILKIFTQFSQFCRLCFFFNVFIVVVVVGGMWKKIIDNMEKKAERKYVYCFIDLLWGGKWEKCIINHFNDELS